MKTTLGINAMVTKVTIPANAYDTFTGFIFNANHKIEITTGSAIITINITRPTETINHQDGTVTLIVIGDWKEDFEENENMKGYIIRIETIHAFFGTKVKI